MSVSEVKESTEKKSWMGLFTSRI